MKQRFLLFLFSFIALAVSAQTDTEHVRLTNLPHVYINTFTGQSITSKTTYVYAKMWYVDEDDAVAFYDSLEIRGRGNSTWSMEKKPYRLKFHEKEKLLGKGYAKTKKWTLLANHGDKTLLRNALTSLMGKHAGLKFNPAAKFVDFTLNGRYVGNYQISDHVDVRPHRVNVTEQDYPLTETSDITGGYLLEADGFKDFQNGRTGFYSPRRDVPFRIHYPDEDEIDYTQYQYIYDYVQTFESQLYSNDFMESSSWRAMVDSTSLVNWYICTEMSANVDGFFSTYCYKDRGDDHFFWGPLWDYDIAYNNDNRTRNGTNNTTYQMMVDAGYGAMRQWVVRMWQDPWFARLAYRRLTELVDGGIEAYLNEQLDSLTTLIDASQQLNYERWGINRSTLRELVLYSSYDQYVADLRKFLSLHIPFLQKTFADKAGVEIEPEPEPEPEPKVPDFEADRNVYYTISNAGTATFVDLLDGTESVCCNARDEQSESQQWQVIPLSNGYLYVVNRATGYALNDPTEGEPTATTQVGTRLNTVVGDSLDTRQQWDFVAQSSGRYNLVNHFSQHAANLSGGNTANGTSVLSYTSDDRNASSNNRMWRLQAVDVVPEPVNIVTPDTDYALAYDPTTCRLHFGADDLSALSFVVRLYGQNGHLLRTFRASEGATLSDLPGGLYLVTWQEGAHRRSVKLVKK